MSLQGSLNATTLFVGASNAGGAGDARRRRAGRRRGEMLEPGIPAHIGERAPGAAPNPPSLIERRPAGSSRDDRLPRSTAGQRTRCRREGAPGRRRQGHRREAATAAQRAAHARRRLHARLALDDRAEVRQQRGSRGRSPTGSGRMPSGRGNGSTLPLSGSGSRSVGAVPSRHAVQDPVARPSAAARRRSALVAEREQIASLRSRTAASPRTAHFVVPGFAAEDLDGEASRKRAAGRSAASTHPERGAREKQRRRGARRRRTGEREHDGIGLPRQVAEVLGGTIEVADAVAAASRAAARTARCFGRGKAIGSSSPSLILFPALAKIVMPVTPSRREGWRAARPRVGAAPARPGRRSRRAPRRRAAAAAAA